MTKSLPFTDDADANRLLAEPTALMIAMTLYQQIPVEKAMAGPAELKRRLGTELDAAAIAAMDPADLDEVFRQKPALHRFPGNMAKRVHAMCNALVDEYGGDASRIWADGDAADIKSRLDAIPGFGDYKSRVLMGVLGERLGVRPKGWEEFKPTWPSIADVATFEDIAEMKARKKAWKESQS